jgi:hypothetical protein
MPTSSARWLVGLPGDDSAPLLPSRHNHCRFDGWRAGFALALLPRIVTKTIPSISSVVLLAFVLGACVTDDGDICDGAAATFAGCGLDLPPDFEAQCAADPDMFSSVVDAACPESGGKSDGWRDWIPLWEGPGEVCTSDDDCQWGLSCVPSKAEVLTLGGYVLEARVIEHRCTEPAVGGFCDLAVGPLIQPSDDCPTGRLCEASSSGLVGAYGSCR